jgi:hypothetical protein
VGAGDAGNIDIVLPPDAASPGCSLYAAGRDQSCKVDGDCALVPIGGAYCLGCDVGNPRGYLNCRLATINQSASVAYLNAISAAESAYEATHDGGALCFINGCPEEGVPRCVGGMCVVRDRNDPGDDAGGD